MPRVSIVWTAPRRRLDPLLVKVGMGCIIVSITGGAVTVSGIAIASPSAGAGEVGLGSLGLLLILASAFCSVEREPDGGDRQRDPGDVPPSAVEAGGLTTLPVQGPCFGRDAIIDVLVATVLAKPPSPTPVLGPPGVGKTTVTVALLHDRRVERRYGSRRYFVRCEGALEAEAVLTEIATAVGVPIGADLRPRVMAALALAPALLVLDNVETPWLPDTLATEQLLLSMASVPRLALVASVRGTQRPGGGVWRPPIHMLPLSEDDARKVFLEVAGTAYKDDPDLSELLAALDGLPLAVELLAHAAEGEPNLTALRRRWVDERVTMLSRGTGDDRLLSLAVSLELSITGPLMTDEARRLLSLLGVLPDGISHQDLELILPGIAERGASILRKVGLAFDERQRVRCLAPVRDYAASAHPPIQDDVTQAVAHYISLVQDLGRRVGKEGGAEAVVRLVAESANVEAMILAGLSGERPRASIEGALALVQFTRFTGIGSTRVQAASCAAASRLNDPSLHAQCIHGLGLIAFSRSDHEGARARLKEALLLFRHAGEVRGEANCIFYLGVIALERSENQMATMSFEEALPLFHQAGDVGGEANCIFSLGVIALKHSDHEGARMRFEEALTLFRQLGDVLGEGNCVRTLGDIALGRSNHNGARAHYEEALTLFRQVGDPGGEANCIRCLGDIAVERSDHDEARARYEAALTLFRQVGSVRGVANCIKGLGDIALERSSHEEARAHYEEALTLFRQVGDVLGEGNCAQRFGDLAMGRSDHEGARKRFEEALLLFVHIEDPHSVGETHRRLARVATSAADCSRHQRAAQEAWTSIGRDDLVRDIREEFSPTGDPQTWINE
jgi:tetratricopeptide (TPR) repeat protein